MAAGIGRRSAWRAASAALLLAVAGLAASAAGAAESKPLTAILIVARAELPDPTFAHAVVLVLNNLGPAPAGIIINHPTGIPVAELFPEEKRLARLPDKLYFGGPVELSSVWFLIRAAKAPGADAVKACEGVYLSGSRDLLMKLLARAKPLEGLRIFVGHAGWGPGQLEAEIARGDWKLEHAQADGIFDRRFERRAPAPQEPKDGT
ncbi:MAG TPA: YqgE/AlgH family protein [Steroidobacteraceae bacterium]|nr:YqgE/AlgH family protein [Gammaproteobacteria bacterium]HEV2284676.1 YqgE/AlgH family protein [Steroidobacteraceae bacterium]